jgi:hypothetical protein
MLGVRLQLSQDLEFVRTFVVEVLFGLGAVIRRISHERQLRAVHDNCEIENRSDCCAMQISTRRADCGLSLRATQTTVKGYRHMR